MTKSLILYDLKNKNNAERTHILKNLYGYTDKSNRGKYTYQRKGSLSKFKYEKWNKSAILVSNTDVATITKMLKKFGLKILIMKLPKKKA
jgi:hypothetical protein